MRYARRVDANQAEIVAALRKAGAKVKVVHQPYDLQIWAGDRTMYIEVKNPKTHYGRKGLNGKQTEESKGLPVYMVDGVEAALSALRILQVSDKR
jgi:hypothetical protein